MAGPARLTESESSRELFWALVLTAIHVVLWAGLFLFLLMVVPQYVRTFEKLDAPIPWLSKLVIRSSMATVAYWYLFALLGMIGLAIDFTLLFVVGGRGRPGQLVAGVLLALPPLVLAAGALLGVWMPMSGISN